MISDTLPLALKSRLGLIYGTTSELKTIDTLNRYKTKQKLVERVSAALFLMSSASIDGLLVALSLSLCLAWVPIHHFIERISYGNNNINNNQLRKCRQKKKKTETRFTKKTKKKKKEHTQQTGNKLYGKQINYTHTHAHTHTLFAHACSLSLSLYIVVLRSQLLALALCLIAAPMMLIGCWVCCCC